MDIKSSVTLIGIYTGDVSPDDQALFITERHTLVDLLGGLSSACSCGMTRNPWILESVIQVRMHNYAYKCSVFLADLSHLSGDVKLLHISTIVTVLIRLE